MENEKTPWEAEEDIEESMSEIMLICEKLQTVREAGYYMQKTFRVLNLVTDIRSNIVFLHENKVARYKAQLEYLTADFAVPETSSESYRSTITSTLTSIRKHIRDLTAAAEIYQEIFGDDDSAYDTSRVGDTVTAGYAM